MPTLDLLGCLALGGVLRLFDVGRWMTSAAAWLAPVLLLHAARLPELGPSLALVWLVLFLAASVAYRGVIPIPGLAYPVVVALLAGFWTLPYAVDRLLAPHLPGFVATLVFPLAWVTMELLLARLSPYGTWGAAAYSQYGQLPLMQLAAVTGLAGIAFLMAWLASTINWAWDLAWQWPVIGGGVVTYGVVLGLVLLAGGVRLAWRRPAPRSGWPRWVGQRT